MGMHLEVVRQLRAPSVPCVPHEVQHKRAQHSILAGSLTWIHRNNHMVLTQPDLTALEDRCRSASEPRLTELE